MLCPWLPLEISIHYLLKRDEEITAIKNGDDRALSQIYLANRPFFISWFKKNSGADESLITAWYQEAFFIMFENFRTNKLMQLDTGILAYLIGIGKNLERDHRKNGWSKHVFSCGEDSALAVNPQANETLDNDTAEQVRLAVDSLGEKCRQILMMFYYQKCSMKVIADRQGLKNEDVAKKTKYECLKKLREIYLSNGN